MKRLPLVPMLGMVCMVALGLVMLNADTGANHQVRSTDYGVSGGNVNDRSRAFCCSGTLGALVSRGDQFHVLSNNHVLARSGSGVIGDDVSQPGAIDVGCNISNTTIVGDLASYVGLGGATNVDAATAVLRSGTMNATGAIVDIGIPNQTPVLTPTVGREVAKSGRTTGLTCASIGSINTTVSVQYQAGCNQGKKFTVTYTNQIVVNSSSFSAGGDSGSLIVTQDNASPIALLYAGSSSTTIGNRIGDVINAYNLSFIGKNRSTSEPVSCGGGGQGGGNNSGRGPGGGGPRQLPDTPGIDRATFVKERVAERLMRDPAVMAVGVGADPDNPSEAAIHVYVEEGRAHGRIPARVDGVRTHVIYTDRIRAFGWNEEEPAACPAE